MYRAHFCICQVSSGPEAPAYDVPHIRPAPHNPVKATPIRQSHPGTSTSIPWHFVALLEISIPHLPNDPLHGRLRMSKPRCSWRAQICCVGDEDHSRPFKPPEARPESSRPAIQDHTHCMINDISPFDISDHRQPRAPNRRCATLETQYERRRSPPHPNTNPRLRGTERLDTVPPPTTVHNSINECKDHALTSATNLVPH
jgi:hypothetical protein